MDLIQFPSDVCAEEAMHGGVVLLCAASVFDTNLFRVETVSRQEVTDITSLCWQQLEPVKKVREVREFT